MSMHVDLSTPLTEEERQYLAMRGRYAELERAAQLTGESVGDLGTGDGTGPAVMPLGTAEQRAGERERLLARLKELDAADGEQDEEELPPYEQWKVQELDKELKGRGLPTDGDKPTKVQRLYADDQAASQQP